MDGNDRKPKLTVHTYDEKTASEISSLIRERYFEMFLNLHITLEQIRSGEQTSLY